MRPYIFDDGSSFDAADLFSQNPAEVATALSMTARKILDADDLEEVLEVICKEACRVLKADQAVVIQLFTDFDRPAESETIRKVLSFYNVPREVIRELEAIRNADFLVRTHELGNIEIIGDLHVDIKEFTPPDIPKIWPPNALRRPSSGEQGFPCPVESLQFDGAGIWRRRNPAGQGVRRPGRSRH